MMYNNELLFVDKFLSSLKELKVEKIPFKNDRYRAGVRAMQLYFRSIESNIDKSVRDIKLLFLDGGEGDFVDAIMELNDGKSISFELHNPYYEMATIKMSESTVNGIMQDNDLKLSNDIILELTKSFCDGARVEISK